MSETKMVDERVLVEQEQTGEWRRVSLIEGPSLGLIEQCRGPVTRVAFGTPGFCHKVLCGREACARVLGVREEEAVEGLAAYFGQEDAPLLSDLMDRFDQMGERYTYMSWSSAGDAAYRSERLAV